jgi:hypothetical protein
MVSSGGYPVGNTGRVRSQRADRVGASLDPVGHGGYTFLAEQARYRSKALGGPAMATKKEIAEALAKAH